MRPMHTARAVAAMAVPMLLGCGGAAVDDPTVLGLPTDFMGPGVYTVPADPTVPFAVAKVHVEQAGGSVSVYYDLPAVFAAENSHIELTGPADGTATVHLTGDAGSSTCTVAAGVFSCDENLSGTRFDVQATATLPPGDPRAAAVKAFIGEPIGVLDVTLSGSAGTSSDP